MEEGPERLSVQRRGDAAEHYHLRPIEGEWANFTWRSGQKLLLQLMRECWWERNRWVRASLNEGVGCLRFLPWRHEGSASLGARSLTRMRGQKGGVVSFVYREYDRDKEERRIIAIWEDVNLSLGVKGNPPSLI